MILAYTYLTNRETNGTKLLSYPTLTCYSFDTDAVTINTFILKNGLELDIQDLSDKEDLESGIIPQVFDIRELVKKVAKKENTNVNSVGFASDILLGDPSYYYMKATKLTNEDVMLINKWVFRYMLNGKLLEKIIHSNTYEQAKKNLFNKKLTDVQEKDLERFANIYSSEFLDDVFRQG